MFAKLDNLRRDNYLAVALSWILLEILLVVILCPVKGSEGFDLCNDWRVPDSRSFDFSDDLLSDCLLFIVVVEDHRAVLGSNISTLAVWSSWVVDCEEDLQDLLEGNYLGVKSDLDHFGMSRPPTADLLVG